MVEVQDNAGGSLPVGTVYAIGRNYAAHARELGNAIPDDPVVFLKARTAVRGLQPAPVAFDETFHHEVELVLRIGRPVPLGGAGSWDDVGQLALGLDLTRREVQARCKEKGLPWTPSKSFAGSAVLGPFLPLAQVGDPATIRFSLAVNGEARQHGDPAMMLFPVPTILRYLASLAPLEPGDLVFTGTPEGVGPLRVGDRFRMELHASGGDWAFDGQL
jgi:2-keto-4-pentenoate hydratase/2-oxohepta-3-ene-1,7-dioic acid hydratase in catechol pathway